MAQVNPNPSNPWSEEWAAPPKSGQEWKVVLCILAVLLLSEVSIRMVKNKLSKDLVHQAEIPGMIDGFAKSDQPAVLFLGNSLTREGVDDAAFRQAFSGDFGDGSEPFSVIKINPDNTSVIEWRYLFERIARAGAPKKHRVVLGYAQNQLTDDTIVKPRRLGSTYLDEQNQAEMLSEDVPDFAGRTELFLSKFLTSFAMSERIRTRVLVELVPMYEETAQRLNRAHDSNPLDTTAQSAKPVTYSRLDHILAEAEKHSIDLTFVAIPVGEAFELDPVLLEKLASRGIAHIDGRNLQGIDESSYPDGYHMDHEASKVFSKFIGESLLD